MSLISSSVEGLCFSLHPQVLRTIIFALAHPKLVPPLPPKLYFFSGLLLHLQNVPLYGSIPTGSWWVTDWAIWWTIYQMCCNTADVTFDVGISSIGGTVWRNFLRGCQHWRQLKWYWLSKYNFQKVKKKSLWFKIPWTHVKNVVQFINKGTNNTKANSRKK